MSTTTEREPTGGEVKLKKRQIWKWGSGAQRSIFRILEVHEGGAVVEATRPGGTVEIIDRLPAGAVLVSSGKVGS